MDNHGYITTLRGVAVTLCGVAVTPELVRPGAITCEDCWKELRRIENPEVEPADTDYMTAQLKELWMKSVVAFSGASEKFDHEQKFNRWLDAIKE